MNWRGLLIGSITLVVAIVVLALLSREQAGKNQSPAVATDAMQETRSDYYMEGVVSRHFDANGQLSHVLTAPRIDHFQDQKRSLMQQPRIQLARPDGTSWEVSAELADAEHNSEKLSLQRQVSLSRPGLNGLASLRMETDTLAIDMAARTAETADTVRFTSPSGTVTGTGLRANLATEQLELLANVKGHYEQATP